MKLVIAKLWREFKANGIVPKGITAYELVSAAFEAFEIGADEYNLQMKKLRTEGSSA